eukprot:TRINITY_DN23824_c1_g1_i3.p1 TRINITY_DN23824_c1_g1~~TRINITY_DN23824_c1_g1_i3.p1  ORF type:complete len:645 (-),score=40.50 TRINITY_DN23824_c1_g1_i3:1290-3224(-)
MCMCNGYAWINNAWIWSFVLMRCIDTSSDVNKTKLCLYISQALSTFGERAWDFMTGLILLKIDSSTLRLVAALGLSEDIAGMLLGPFIGHYIDRTSDRFKVAWQFYLVQNGGILCACVMAMLGLTMHGYGLCFAIGMIIFSVFGRLGLSALQISVGRDWTKALFFDDPQELARLNSGMMSIDLTSLLVAPILSGALMTYIGDTAGVIFLGTYNAIVWIIEIAALKTAITITPRLQFKRNCDMLCDSITGNNGNETNLEVFKENKSQDCKTLESGNEKTNNNTIQGLTYDDKSQDNFGAQQTLERGNVQKFCNSKKGSSGSATLSSSNSSTNIGDGLNEGSPRTQQIDINNCNNSSQDSQFQSSVNGVQNSALNDDVVQDDRSLVQDDQVTGFVNSKACDSERNNIVDIESNNPDDNDVTDETQELLSQKKKSDQQSQQQQKEWSIQVYFRQFVWPAGFALATLYLTVMSFGILMTSYLKYRGIDEFPLSLWRGAGAISGVISTFSFPKLHKIWGLKTTAWVGIIAQVSSLWFGLLADKLSPLGSQKNLNFLVTGLVCSRWGLYTFDAGVLQMLQDWVPNEQIGRVNGVQNGLQKAFELGSFIFTMVIANPAHFVWLMWGSVGVVSLAMCIYTIWLSWVKATNLQ